MQKKINSTSLKSKKAPKLKLPFSVGVFYTPTGNIELLVEDGDNGNFWLAGYSKDHNLPAIFIGISASCWGCVLTTIIHEIEEFLYVQKSHRYANTQRVESGSCGTIFIFSHDEMVEMNRITAEFLEEVVPPIKKVWKKYQKELKEKTKNA